ncbi:MAG: haloacid dehalogenase-like hydrolase [Candidatus Neomarinimicrobiota bacterium]|nr:haloacid dehalogenase-like hydrolase [Candidatus Neomarinimicrobiota bacterium]MEE3135152.1 haloacid dehalogenase-like hydrolase [Candidatus Neomarinimicrobiota bacterium]
MFPDHLIIDFDSTFVTVESLDELAHIVLKDNPESAQRLETIRAITRAGMEGSIPFDESLSKRLKLLNINQKDIHAATIVLAKKVTPSFKRNKQFLMENSQNILIISGGFYEMIIPIVSEYGILEDQVFANKFVYKGTSRIAHVDSQNIMAQSGEKVAQANALGLAGEIHVIGDGYTDYQIKSEGPAKKFFAFIENIRRNSVCEVADVVLSNIDDYIKFLAE